MREEVVSEKNAWDKKHAVIISAAKDAFIERGYAASSMDAIAERAGVSKMTVYNHFKNKEELFSTIMDVHCKTLAPARPLIIFDPKKKSRETLVDFCFRFIDMLLQPASVALMRRIIAEVDHFPELAESMWKGGMPLFDGFCRYLDAEVEAKRLAISDTRLATRQLFGMLKENTVYPVWFGVKTSFTKEQLKEVVESSVDLFLGSYGARQ